MATERLRVVLTMEPSLLSSAIAQCLASNARLEVLVKPPVDGTAGPILASSADLVRTVRIGLLEGPVRFAIQADGRGWTMPYRSVDGLARVLADLQDADVSTVAP